jgi:hypothetical protein
MAINYLYIDDEQNETVEGIKKNLTSDSLTIDIKRPFSWDKQIEWLIDENNLDKYDGLLIDLKLEFSDANNKLKYFGPDLAQAIRTKTKEGKIKDLPILLCTTDQNLMNLFDRTSSDLFDKKFNKKYDFSNDKSTLQFIAFAEAYHAINENKKVSEILKSNPSLLHEVEIECQKFTTSHDISNFIYHQVINCQGIFIDEPLLAIRFGIDFEFSPGWNDFKEQHLKKFMYEGIFSTAHQRWYQNPVLDWWKSVTGRSLQVLDANERVSKIKELLGPFDLKPLTLPEAQHYSNFWYRCIISNVPLESGDGLMTIHMPKYIWQEPSFVSMNYIMSEGRDAQKIKGLLGSNELKIFEDILSKQRGR